MEQQFKKLLQISHDQNDPLFKTFEGALFEGAAWFLQTETTRPLITSTEILPPEIVKEVLDPPIFLTEVLFVGDSYKGEGEDLLGKMILAMKLSGTEFSRLRLDEELEGVEDLAGNLAKPNASSQKLFSTITEKKPKIVVSLGATVTNVLLGKREKLSGIHGQFIEKSIDDCTFILVPIFHPDFLMINPNMKRTAWIDLQKVMERVGKI